MRRSLRTVLTVLMAGTGSLYAQDRLVYDTRALAMGGTGVASAAGAAAAFYNPAIFVTEKSPWDFTLPIPVLQADLSGEFIAVGDKIADDYDDESLFDIQAALDGGTVTAAQRQQVLETFLYDTQGFQTPGDGLTVRASLGPAFRFGNWGFSAVAMGYAGVDPVVDLSTGVSLGAGGFSNAIPATPDNCGGDPFCQSFAAILVADTSGQPFQLTNAQAEQLVFDAGIASLASDPKAQATLRSIVRETAAGGSTLEDNPSGLETRGVLIRQYAFTYSRTILGGDIAVGGSIKLLNGETYRKRLIVADFEDGDEALNDITDRKNRESSTAVGLDLGLLWRTPVQGLVVGLSGMNLNSPEFEFAGNAGEFTLSPLVRTGVAWTRGAWLTLAADLELSTVDSDLVDGADFQHASLGSEFVVARFLALRAGATKNLGNGSDALAFTGGVGFAFGKFRFEISGALATDHEAIESGGNPDTLPAGGAVGISFGWRDKI